MNRSIVSPAPFNGVTPDDMERNLPAMGFHRISMELEDDLSATPTRIIYDRRLVRDDPDDPPETVSTVDSKKKKRPAGEDRPKNLPAGKPPAATPAATPALKKPEKTKPPSEDDRPKNLPKPDPPSASPAAKKPEKTKPPSEDDRPKNFPANPGTPVASPALKKPEKTKPSSEDDRQKNLPKPDPPTTSPALKKPEKTKPPSEDDRPKNFPANPGAPPPAGIAESPVPSEPQSLNPIIEVPLKPTPPAQNTLPDTPPAADFGNPLIPQSPGVEPSIPEIDSYSVNPLKVPVETVPDDLPSAGQPLLKTPGTFGRKDEEEDALPEPVLIPVQPVPSIAQAAPVVTMSAAPGNKPVEIPGTGNSGTLNPEPLAGVSPPISEPIHTYGAEPGKNSLSVQSGKFETDFLTTVQSNDFNDERLNMEARPGLLTSIGSFFRDLFDAVFKSGDAGVSSEASYVPAVYTSGVKPPVVSNPVESFRAGYISQRDLETALGREDWTMCCATTFIYAVQTKYPGLSREKIIDAAGKAAKTELADGSGPCVSDDGYVASIHQYSQALSRELGLTDYVDTPGVYPSIKAASAAGVTMMKVELSGRLGEEKKEHHVLQYGSSVIDPVSAGSGIADIWEKNSIRTENVMALDWYELP